jgi:hypothetical protein
LPSVHRESTNGNDRKSSSTRKEVVVPPTPSKVLFSPLLRTDPNAAPSPQNDDRFEEGDEESEDEYTEDVAPSTPVISTPQRTPQKEEAQQEEEEAEDDSDEFNPYQFIAHLPPHASVCIQDKICLPPLGVKKQELPTLALDLDETLVHCTVEPIPKPDLVFPVKYANSQLYSFILLKPYSNHCAISDLCALASTAKYIRSTYERGPILIISWRP